MAGDYDIDDDGLIEVSNLAQLNAMRWDRDGDGANSDATNYTAAFPNAAGMGCPTNDTDNDCTGYELTADLDFDTNGDGDVDANDHKVDTDGDGDVDSDDDDVAWWDDGKGWAPIRDDINSFGAEFEGNGHTIANLFINRTSAGGGLFGAIVSGGKIRNVGLTGVNITARNNTGALVGTNRGAITASYAEGRVHATSSSGSDRIRAGGLVGDNVGTITGSYAIVNVYGKAAAGGLVGEGTGRITDSYAAGSVSGHGTGSIEGESGGLVGNMDSGSRVDTSYAVGPVSGVNAGGLASTKHASAAVNNSYWDEDLTGQSASEGGTKKTTEELQAPTAPPLQANCDAAAYVGDKTYCGWGDRWDFGDANHFPLLKADWDGDGTATVAEFGNQDREPSFADTDTVADLTLPQDVAYTTGTALPTATGGNGALTYALAPLPAGVTFTASTRIIGGKPTVFQAKTATAYTVTDTDDGTDTISFTLGIGPPATTLAAAPGNANVNLTWDAIAGVAGWEYLQNTSSSTNTTWTAIDGSDDETASHRVTGLTNSTAYTFKVRAFVGDDSASPSTRVDGAESNAETKTPDASLDNLPTMASIPKKEYTQGAAITALVLPAATGGDGHPNYNYALRPGRHNRRPGPGQRHAHDLRYAIDAQGQDRLHLDGHGAERPGRDSGLGQQGLQHRHRAQEAGGLRRGGRRRAGRAVVDGHRRRDGLGVQAGQHGQHRQLDGRPEQRRRDRRLHRPQPHQRHGVQLQGARLRGGERGARRRRRVGRRDGDAGGRQHAHVRGHRVADLRAGLDSGLPTAHSHGRRRRRLRVHADARRILVQQRPDL